MSKIQKIGEAVRSRLNQPLTTSPRFNLDLPMRFVRNRLGKYYEQEVEKRGGKLTITPELMNTITKTVNELIANNGKLGMLYCGVCGNGKTTMLRAFEAMVDYFYNKGWCKDAMAVLSARRIAELTTDNVRFSNICKIPLLGIDDLGTEAPEVVIYGNIRKPLTELLEYRYDRQLYTVITTNLPPKDIGTIYGERVADRFRETIVPIVFTNKSYRK